MHGSYLAAGVSAALASLRLSQLYFFWNFSTRPVVSTNFILPVKNGWHAEQISTEMFFLVLRVTNLLPQPQVTVHSSYFGWMSFFMAWLGFRGFRVVKSNYIGKCRIGARRGA